jgi:hypothetical protein
MSAFEFILVLVSVVAGFAVSEILSGWGRMIRERVPIAAVGVHLVASCYLLIMIIRSVWVLWVLREHDWLFIDFIFVFAPILVLALAAYVINPARIQRFDSETHYLSQARPLCYLITVYFCVSIVGAMQMIGAEILPTVASVAGMVMFAMFLVLAHVRRPMIHGIGFGIAIAVTTFMSMSAVTSL